MDNDCNFLEKSLIELKKCFPKGLELKQYYSLLFLMYENYSDRNLALVVSTFTGFDISRVYNDILGIKSKNIDPNDISRTNKIIEDMNAIYLIRE